MARYIAYSDLNDYKTIKIIFGDLNNHRQTGTMRRRLYYAGIIVTVLISILCSCTAVGAIKNSVAPDRGENFSNSSDDSFDQELRASLESNYYLIAIHHPIEEAYIKEQTEMDGSTTSMIDFYDKYQSLWKDEAEKYKGLIESEICSSSDTFELFQNMIKQWDMATDAEITYYIQLEVDLHSDGTIKGANIARYKMEIYREYAINLIKLYDEIMVGRGWSWKNQEM